MATYWVGDTVGRVLGPLTLQSLRELIGAGRMRNVVRASRDGNTWMPLHELEEIKDLLGAVKPSPSMEQQQAERLRTQLRGLQALKTPQEVFGVKPQATLDEVRLAFFRMAKRFSPDHLEQDTHPDLKKVSVEIFQFLSQRMRDAEAQLASGTPSRTPPPVLGAAAPGSAPAARTPPTLTPTSTPARTPPTLTPAPGARTPPALTPAPGARTPPPLASAPPPSASPSPSSYRPPAARSTAPAYAVEEFVGLRRESDKTYAEIRVTPKNLGMFMDHPLINLATGGVFIPSERPLRLGTPVELTLRFEQPVRAITLRSSVIWENALEDGRQPRGYGLRLSDLRPEERTFVQEFVRNNRAKP